MTSTPTPTLDLDALQRLCDEATGGTWEVGTEGNGTPGYVYCNNALGSAVAIVYGKPLNMTVFTRREEEANAAFIAAFNPVTASALIAKCRELQEANDKWRQKCEEIVGKAIDEAQALRDEKSQVVDVLAAKVDQLAAAQERIRELEQAVDLRDGRVAALFSVNKALEQKLATKEPSHD